MMRLSEIVSPRPTAESLAAQYAEIERGLDRPGIDVRRQALDAWDQARRDFETWMALADIHFHQDTGDMGAKADRAHGDAMKPEATAYDIRLKQRLLAESDRAAKRTAHREAALIDQV